MTMESLGDILRRITAGSMARHANGTNNGSPPEEPPRRECPLSICNGSGWIGARVPVEHPDFGQAKPCQCRQMAESTTSRMESLRRYSKLGPLSRLTFATTHPEGTLGDVTSKRMFSESLTEAAAYAENPEGWLVITGPSGSGKTHLAAAVANRCIERQQTTFFILVADLLDHLRSTYSPSSEIAYDELFEQVRNVPLLILDELGGHSSTPWAQEKLHQLINHRYNHSMPTVVTISGPLARLDESLRTRLNGGGERSIVLQLGHLNSRLALGIGEIRSEMLTRMTFAEFNTAGGRKATTTDQEGLARALSTAETFAAFPEGWLIFTGNRGSGKTHLAVAIAGESLKQGHQVFFAFVPTLLDHLRRAYSPDSGMGFDDLFEQVLNVPLLILDDLGSENSTPWAEEKLYQIVVHRHEARLSTVITTASTIEELEQSKPRIASRLEDSMVVDWIPIDAPSYRNRGR